MNLNQLKLLLAGALLAAGSAQATVTTYKYTAVIDSMQKQVEGDGDYWGPVDVTSSNVLYGYAANVGDILHGQFMVDTTATIGTSTSVSSTYWGQNITSYVKFPSGYDYGSPGPSEYGGGQATIVNAPDGDAFNISFVQFGSGSGESLVLGFSDPTGSAFSSKTLPTGPINFATLPITEFYYYFGASSFSTNLWVHGHITSVQLDGPAPVPEPATYGMLLAGLALLSAAARRKRDQ